MFYPLGRYVMSRKTRKKSKQIIEKIAALGSLCILIAAWWLGGIEISERQITLLNSLANSNQQLLKVDDDLYKVVEFNDQIAWLGVGKGVGYGGELTVAVKMDMDGTVHQTSIVSIKDTASYISKVIDSGFVHQFLDISGKKTLSVDAVSGATLSSNGIMHAINTAADQYESKFLVTGCWKLQVL